MEVKVLTNLCETCKTLNCNSCRDELVTSSGSNVVKPLPYGPGIGERYNFYGDVKIVPVNASHSVALGNVISGFGKYVRAVGNNKLQNALQLVYTGDNTWRAIEIIGLWEVETE